MDNIIENFYLNGGISRGLRERKEIEENREFIRNKVLNYTIDSCWTFDEGYETAIWKDHNPMIIVERYSTKEEMKKGHNKWCVFCKNEPTEAYSVQLDEIEKF